jgi:hypothetical protein
MEGEDHTAANEEALRSQAANVDLTTIQSLVNDHKTNAKVAMTREKRPDCCC